jgi:hypothetical protein
MSNNFKDNSRFSVLIENNTVNKSEGNKHEGNKHEGNKKNRNNKNNNVQKDRVEDNFLKQKNQIVTYKEKEILVDGNFPELVITSKIQVTTQEKETIPIISFADKVKTVVKDKTIDNKEYIPPGYIVIEKDKITNKFVKKYGEVNYIEQEDVDNYSIYDIMQNLIEIYEKRKEEYIDLWGYDEWEKMFRFPNYDYEYFDKLDEVYEEKMSEYVNESDYNYE